MNARYELGSLKMLALVTELFGATVGSVQPVQLRLSRTAATLTALVVRFMSLSPLEPDVQAGGDGARARVDVVVDAVEARRRIDAAVSRDRERVLDRSVHPERLPPIAEVVADVDVIHSQERRVFDEKVRVVLRNDKSGLEDGGMQVTRHSGAREVLIGAVRGCHVVVDVVPEVGPDREAGVEPPGGEVRGVPEDPFRRRVVEGPPVGIIDDPVAVPVDVHVGRRGVVVDGFPGRIVLLLEDEERVDRYTRLENLDQVAHTARDVAPQDLRYTLIRVDAD